MAVIGGGSGSTTSHTVTSVQCSTKVRYPAQAIDPYLVDDGDDTNIINVWNSKTIVDAKTTPSADGVDRVIAFEIDDADKHTTIAGDIVIVKSKSTDTETTTLTASNSILDNDVVLGGTAGQEQVAMLLFDGTELTLISLYEIE